MISRRFASRMFVAMGVCFLLLSFGAHRAHGIFCNNSYCDKPDPLRCASQPAGACGNGVCDSEATARCLFCTCEPNGVSGLCNCTGGG